MPRQRSRLESADPAIRRLGGDTRADFLASGRVRALLQHNCIVWIELATRNKWRITAGPGARVPVRRKKPVGVTGNLRTTARTWFARAVLDGVRIGYSPVWLFSDELRSGKVSTLLLDWSATLLPMRLVGLPARRYSTKVRLFGDCVADALQDVQ